jgi:uncharacterized protein YqgC (DUF456 family)
MFSDGGKGAELVMEAVLAALGAGTNDVLAAFLGSICGSFFLPEAKPRAILGTVFVGTCVGIYFGPNSMLLIGKQPSNVITFIFGSIGMAALAAAGNYLKAKLFNGGKNVPVPVDVRRDP